MMWRPLAAWSHVLWVQVQRIYWHAAHTPPTPTFIVPCQNWSRKASSHLKSKAFSWFFSALATGKGQSGRFIGNRKEVQFESLFLLTPLSPWHRNPQHPWVAQEGHSAGFPNCLVRLAVCSAQTVSWEHLRGYVDASKASAAKLNYLFKKKKRNFLSWMFDDVLKDRTLKVRLICGR